MESQSVQHNGACTLYRRSEIMGNIVKVECRRFEARRRPYAQYQSAVEFRFVPKGKRRERGAVETFKSSLLVLPGHGHPEPDSMLDHENVETNPVTGVTVARGRYAGHDPRWQADFDQKINAYIKAHGIEPLWDTRGEEVR